MAEVLEDSCFHEYFVEGANGFVTNMVNKTIGLVNGMLIQYHSLVFADDTQKALFESELNWASPGDVISFD